MHRLLDDLPEEEHLLIYGDKAYFYSFGCLGTTRNPAGSQMSQEEEALNRYMSTFRIAVEHRFSLVSRPWRQHRVSHRLGI